MRGYFFPCARSAAKKRAQPIRALVGEHAAHDREAVVQARVLRRS